ncbi:hypothetical protein, partial [Cohnella hongkongensis]
YYYEYRFRCNNAHAPVQALSSLILGACTTIYTLNEYGMLRERKRRDHRKNARVSASVLIS